MLDMNLRKMNRTTTKDKNPCKHLNLKYKNFTYVDNTKINEFLCLDCGCKIRKTNEQILNDALSGHKPTLTCDHEWVDDGRDSHYNYYRCVICGKEERG